MRRRFLTSGAALYALSAAALLFFALPLVVLVWRAVGTRSWEGAPEAGVTQAVILSLVTTTLTTLITLIIGTPLAYVLARKRFPLRRAVGLLLEMPIVMPPAVAGLALLLTFGRRGALAGTLNALGISLAFSTAAVVLAQVFVSAPFFIRAAQVGFENVPREVEDAARVDGAGTLAIFRWVMLPLAARALGAGLALSWARAMGEFGATILFAGSFAGRTQTMPLLVYGILETDLNAAIWTSLLLLALAFGALLVAGALGGGRAEGDFS